MEFLKRLYGKPVPGGSGSISVDGTDKTAALAGGSMYLLYSTEDCWIAIDGPSTTEDSRLFVPAAAQVAFTFGRVGQVPVMHATQVTAPGVLYYSRMELP